MCEHDKVYANFVLTSNPPMIPWICKKCKKQGQDAQGKVASNEYDSLIYKL